MRPRPARLVAHDDVELVACLEHEGCLSQTTGADLRAREVLQHANNPRLPSRRGPDVRNGLPVTLARSVREIEAEHVHASADQRVDGGFAARRRPNRRYDFRPPHGG